MTDAPPRDGRCAEIALRNVVKHYSGRTRAAVEHLNLEIPAGEICVLIGPSGAARRPR